jgi:thioredoxin-like negative regulator of GroEL
LQKLESEGERPLCAGKTIQPYFRSIGYEGDTMVAEITGQDFDEEVLKSDLPVFVCFTTSPCGSCFALCLVVEDLAEEYAGRMRFAMVNVEKEPQLAARYHILPLPRVLLFRHGKPLKELGGFHDKAHLKNALNALIAENEQSQ